ncbi:2-dehydropantoate 2-reductase [Stenotrophomonas sp. Betaine-02u-21]|uniref:2-dehydropantoate 2-reductase n=1 Tax=unclassified Stenotrophomonas TaxID=196198 RepID=UPI000C34F898|nr:MULTISPECIES: 2-dehydropantoate 2-reductase [unclassified Stenotrophomonas]PKH71454.1 2-dehydropantoate 2-reductase [Stenotrophomonas sp. Betaine-02u-21]PKH72108.1 2-dehydropantoate 2-reductase [Stenotrophomonas sp. Betaine-02u-23]PKH96389.1 2-dehydropantoate 2-reductase [Stenotrophomonas sp. Bg11-02]
MRILILGAGGTGGYFGGRLAQAGVDVTFLVRPARADQLQRDGLVIRSPLGDAAFPVQHVTADALPALVAGHPFDLVVLSCKAYDLDSSIEAIAPAVGPRTSVLPILNGLHHYAALDARFGRDAVMGGLCFISAAKDADGAVLHLAKPAKLTFGERDDVGLSARVLAFAAACVQGGVDHLASEDIRQEQWVKYTFLTALAAATCLRRADIGTIMGSEGGEDFLRALYAECVAVAEASGEPIPASAQETALAALTQPGSALKASMLRDLEAGQQVEADHIVGDMLARARGFGQDAPLLAQAFGSLQAYQTQRAG